MKKLRFVLTSVWKQKQVIFSGVGPDTLWKLPFSAVLTISKTNVDQYKRFPGALVSRENKKALTGHAGQGSKALKMSHVAVRKEQSAVPAAAHTDHRDLSREHDLTDARISYSQQQQ